MLFRTNKERNYKVIVMEKKIRKKTEGSYYYKDNIVIYY